MNYANSFVSITTALTEQITYMYVLNERSKTMIECYIVTGCTIGIFAILGLIGEIPIVDKLITKTLNKMQK